MTVREIRQTSRFKKDYKAAVRRGLPKDELRAVIEALANDEPLPERCRPHLLSGNWVGHWECHIRSDWLAHLQADRRRHGAHARAHGNTRRPVRRVGLLRSGLWSRLRSREPVAAIDGWRVDASGRWVA